MKNLLIIILLFIALLSPIANARPVRPYSPKRIIQKAQVLAVGEVLEVNTIKKIPKQQTKWKIPLLQMKAKIRILRSFSISNKQSPQKNKNIFLKYHAIEREKCQFVDNGPRFPYLFEKDVFVFPLKEQVAGHYFLPFI